MSHLRDSDCGLNNDSTSIANRNTEIPEEANVVPIGTPGRPKRTEKPTEFEDCCVGKRQKRESDAAFFCSIGCDPLTSESPCHSWPVLETLDDNLPAATAPHQVKVNIANGTALATPGADEMEGGVADLALQLDPVNLAGADPKDGDENGCHFHNTKHSFLHQSGICDEWSQRSGKSFQKKLELAVEDEQKRDGSNGTTAKRVIDRAKLAPAMWDMTTFPCTTRNKKTRAKAMVQLTFREMADKNPEVFGDVLAKESSCHLRREVFQAWKFQRSIDVFTNGGLNCEALNTIRSGVEGSKKSGRGVMPSGSTVAGCAKELESHGPSQHGLAMLDSTAKHGPSLSFDVSDAILLLVKGHGSQEFAIASSKEKPVLFSFTLDGAQLTNQLGHVTAGTKIVDPRAKDPLTGLLISVSI